MTLPPESTMSMDEAPAAASEPPSTAQPEKVASPNVASGSTPELSAGASAMTSAEARSRASSPTGSMANDFPVVRFASESLKEVDPVHWTVAVTTSPGRTASVEIGCIARDTSRTRPRSRRSPP